MSKAVTFFKFFALAAFFLSVMTGLASACGLMAYIVATKLGLSHAAAGIPTAIATVIGLFSSLFAFFSIADDE